MKKSIIIGTIVLLLLSAAALLITTNTSKNNSHVVSLPSPSVESGSISSGEGIDRIEVTTGNVKSVLATLSRAENFSRTYTIKSCWTGGESEQTLNYYRSGEKTKLVVSDGSTVRNILVLGDDLYVWYNGYAGLWESTLGESSAGRDVDRFSGLITYEDIQDVPQEDILSAYYTVLSEQPCIYVEYRSGELDYDYRITVSIDTGLLVSMEKYDGDELIYSMESSYTELTSPAADVFDLP